MRQGVAMFAAVCVVAASIPFLREHDDKLLELLSKAKVAVAGEEVATEKKVDPPALTDVDLSAIDDRREVVTAPAHGKRNADLTIDSAYQRATVSILRKGQVDEGSVVMTDIRTGRVLVWANYNRGRPRNLASEATAPSASIFKIVTGAALIEAGVSMNEKFCYYGGKSGIEQRDLEANPKRDKYCATLPMAMGRSLNIIYGRLASQHLDPDKLEGVAKRLGWSLDIPFDVPVEISKLEIPRDDDLEFARSAAGFWHTTLSTFQGANLAQTIASGGEMLRSYVVRRVVDEEGDVIYERPDTKQVFKRVLDERTAWAVARMMEQTVRNGTSFKSFHDRAGRPYLPDIRVAGKTGTLIMKEPETLYTRWVGFAPARNPEVAVSVLAANRGPWHVKATHIACDVLRVYFADQGRKGVRPPPGIRIKKKKKKKKAAPASSAI